MVGRLAIALLCLVWLPLGAIAAVHVRQFRTLARLHPPTPPSWPRVSVVIAARDEADTIGSALRSRLAEGYPDLEVIVVDDRSTDGTDMAVREVSCGDPRVSVVHVEELPEGWLGKVYAMQRGLEAATGEWLLFSDADVHVEPGTMRGAIALAEADGLDMIALIPEYDTRRSIMVTAFWTVFLRVALLAFSPAAVRDPRRKAALGSGAFNLVRRTALERTKGFEWLRLETGDDVALGAMIKDAGGRLEMLGGRGSATVEIYPTVRSFITGVEKNGGTTAAHPWRFTLGVLAFLALEYAPFAGLALGPPWLRALGAVSLIVATLMNVAALRLNSAGRWTPALLWPVGSLFFAFGTLRATWLVHHRGGVMWRGTFYPLHQIHAHRRFEL